MSWIDWLGVLGVITPVLVIFGMIAWKAEQRATARREDWERRFRHEAGTQMVEQLVGSNAQVEANNPAFVPGPPPFSAPGPFVRPTETYYGDHLGEDVLFRYQGDTTNRNTNFG